MISLIKILSEIKVTPKIDWKKLTDLRDKIRDLIWDKSEEPGLFEKFWEINHDITNRRVERITKEEMINLYNKFLKLYNEYKDK